MVFQTEYIALRSENNHGRHIEGPFQSDVLKTGHFEIKDFTWFFVQILSTMMAPLYGHGDAEEHLKKQLFGALHPSTLRSSHFGG